MFSRTRTIVPAAALLTGGLICAGCSTSADKEKEAQATVEALPSLPQADIANLKPVSDQQQLATSESLRIAPAPPPEGAAHPNCAADEIESDYTAKVSYPVTVCSVLSVVVGTITTTVGTTQPTHKLEASVLSPEQLAALGVAQPAGQVFWCRQSKGPWQGSLTSDHTCSGTCDLQNVLTLTNTPNVITFHWTGSIQVHPGLNFDFVGAPKLVDTANLGKCHPQNEKPGATGKGK
jgi:hypothetical protein